MHWFDVGVVVVVLLFGLWGLLRGLIREVMSLLGFVAAFVLAARGYPYVAQILESTIASDSLRQALSVGLIFVVVMLVATVLSRVLRMMLHLIGLSLVDRFLGGVFGVLKVTLVVSGLLLVSSKFAPVFTRQLGTESALAPLFFHTAEMLATVLAQQDYDAFKQLTEQALSPLQKLIPGSQAVPAALDTLLPQPPVPAPRPGITPPGAERLTAPAQPAETSHVLPPHVTREPSQATTSPPVARSTPEPDSPPAPSAPESPSSISADDSKALEKILRERLKERRR